MLILKELQKTFDLPSILYFGRKKSNPLLKGSEILIILCQKSGCPIELGRLAGFPNCESKIIGQLSQLCDLLKYLLI